MTILKAAYRPVLIGLTLWLVFVFPPITLWSLLAGKSFYSQWPVSPLWLPIPLMLLISVFRLKSARWRWWVFQYLGVSAIGFTAAMCAMLLSLVLAPRLAATVGLILFAVFLILGWCAAHQIQTVTLRIVSDKITKPLRLVQISDVHIGSRQSSFLEKVMLGVSAQEPDLLLITGDLLDENVSAEALRPLAGLNFPVFFCSGNHERYVNYRKMLDTIASHGVTVLSDAAVSCQELEIIGIEDREHVTQAKEALASVHDPDSAIDRFTILLYHQPNLWDSAVERHIDLTLSGHTHKGQIWPFGWLVRIQYAYLAGHFQKANSHLFVSQGVGTWGPTLRFGTRCEMTVIDLAGSDEPGEQD